MAKGSAMFVLGKLDESHRYTDLVSSEWLGTPLTVSETVSGLLNHRVLIEVVLQQGVLMGKSFRQSVATELCYFVFYFL